MSDDIPENLEEQAGKAAMGAAAGAASGVAAGDFEQAATGALDGAMQDAPLPPEVAESAAAGQQLGQAAAANPSAAAASALGAAAPAAGQAAGQAMQAMGAPPEVASAGVDAATGEMQGSLADAVTEILAGEQALPKAHYVVAIEDGPDAHWMVRRMQFSEGISEPYLLELELVSEDLAADTEQVLGANLELTIDRESVVRTIRGIVHLVEYVGVNDDRLKIRVEVVPALHLLGQRVDTRLWQNASVVEVVTEVLEGAFGDYERELTNNLTGSYEPREYIVQYHESDLDFVSRLLESEGISYWFDHEGGAGKELMVLEDSNDNVVDVTTIDDTPELHI
ncbi:MAG TPA: contractile injection system protein, VgrG/Pvc8 family, partial [Enhygromyxa sp.]|nr:contractile injection system protein, VgrG/Pvc8 family [Enhygromyxa sp.]